MNSAATELSRRHTIPVIYREIVEERLTITFDNFTRLRRGTERRTSKESKLRFQQKKARQIYISVLDEIPQAYLPFIIVVNPSACAAFDFPAFQEELCRSDVQFTRAACAT